MALTLTEETVKKALLFLVLGGMLLPVLTTLGCSSGGGEDFKPKPKQGDVQDNNQNQKVLTPQ